MEKFYTTTAIDYVNGAPHIGHAGEKIFRYKQSSEPLTFFPIDSGFIGWKQ